MALEAYRHGIHEVPALLQGGTSIGPSGSIRADGRRDEGLRCDNNQKKSEIPFGIHWHSAKTSFTLSSNLGEERGTPRLFFRMQRLLNSWLGYWILIVLPLL